MWFSDFTLFLLLTILVHNIQGICKEEFLTPIHHVLICIEQVCVCQVVKLVLVIGGEIPSWMKVPQGNEPQKALCNT